jgi:DNA-binding response OmpR family regulator
MVESPKPLVVAVLDSDPDTTELLKSYLEIEGIVVATGVLIDFRLGKSSLIEFLQRAAPDVIVYDLGIPYEANYIFLQRAREDPGFPPCGVVITTTNARAVQSMLGIHVMEILGKPYDLGALVTAVRAVAAGEAASSDSGRSDEGNRRHGERRHGDRRAGDVPRTDTPQIH